MTVSLNLLEPSHCVVPLQGGASNVDVKRSICASLYKSLASDPSLSPTRTPTRRSRDLESHLNVDFKSTRNDRLFRTREDFDTHRGVRKMNELENRRLNTLNRINVFVSFPILDRIRLSPNARTHPKHASAQTGVPR